MVRDVAVVARVTLVLEVGALGLTIVGLALYNGLAQFERFLACLAVTSGAALLLLVTTTALTTVCLSRMRIDRLVLGDGPRFVESGSMVAHAVACSMVVVVVATTTTIGADARHVLAEREFWERSGNLSALSFRISEAQFVASRGRFAQIARDEDLRGALIVAAHPRPPFTGFDPYEGNSLTVNAEYIERHPVLGSDGRAIRAIDLDLAAMTVLVPERLMPRQEAIVRDWSAWTEVDDHDGARAPGAPTPEVHVRAVQDDQSSFNYGAGLGEATSFQEAPVIAVLPRTGTIPSADWVASAMTSGGVLFDDPARVRIELEQAGLDQFVGSIERVRDHAASAIATDLHRVRESILIGCSGVLMLGLVASVLATTITERRRRIDLLRFTHGGAGSRRFAPLVPVVAMTLATTSALVGIGVADGPFVWAAAVFVSVADGIVLVTSFTLAGRRHRHRATHDH